MRQKVIIVIIFYFYHQQNGVHLLHFVLFMWKNYYY